MMGEYDAGYENCIDSMVRQMEDMQFRIDNLHRENAKLHELCAKALEWLRWAGGITCPPEVPDEFADELRELGVDE